jgi:hypothetical protein
VTRKDEERDFKKRMRDGKKAEEAGKKLKKLCRPVARAEVKVPTHRTGRWKVAKAFQAGKGRYS